MSRTPAFSWIIAVLLCPSSLLADNVIVTVKSGTIAPTKANGRAWDAGWGQVALPDPYVKLWVFDKDGAQVDYGETWYIRNTLTTVWNKDIARAKVGQTIKIEVWDKDLKYDDLIGRYTFALTKEMANKGQVGLRFEQVHDLQLELRWVAPPPREARVLLVQPFPGPHSANHLTRTKGRHCAVILLHGLDLRDDGSSAANARLVEWQGSTSPLVKAISPSADVFAIGYAQTKSVEEVVLLPELRDAIVKVKQLGYPQVVLLGHSAGGLVARHFVEEHPGAGVTKVIQVASPNGGATLACCAVRLHQVPRDQRAFVESLSPQHREALLKSRQDKKIPAVIEFVTVVACASPKAKGDRVINRQCQWTADLQQQGIPCASVQATHVDVMDQDDCLDVFCSLITQPQSRWDASKVQAIQQIK